MRTERNAETGRGRVGFGCHGLRPAHFTFFGDSARTEVRGIPHSIAGPAAVQIIVALLLLGLVLFCSPGCDRAAESPQPNVLAGDEPRIVSFVPAATRMIVDLGLGDSLVGVAENDAAAPERDADGNPMPTLGNFMDVDVERLISLRPTMIYFPNSAGGEADALRPRVRHTGATFAQLDYPKALSDVKRQLDLLAHMHGVPEKGKQLAEPFEVWLGESDERPEDSGLAQTGPSVILGFSIDPVTASGPGSVNDELLHLLGARNAVADAAVSAVTLDREALVACAPDVIVLLLPGATEAEAVAKVAWFDGLPIPAVESGRVSALTDPQVLLPSTNLPEVVEQLRGAILGDTAGVEPAPPAEAAP